jgi:ABC-2 type transport system permease protein
VVFRQALRQAARTITILAVAAGAFYYLILFASKSFLGSGGASEFFRHPPKAVEAFLGGAADFLSPSGWLAAGMTHPVTLSLLTAAAMVVASGAVATEVERGTIDLVLSRPVGRSPFLLAKAAASMVAVTIVELGGMAGVFLAWFTVARVDEIAVGRILLAFLGSWALFSALAMVGVLASARSSLRSHALGAAVGAVVGWFFLNFIALLIDGLSGLRYLSPFHYFRPGDVLAGESPVVDVVVLTGLGIVALAAAIWSFRRRDLSH